MNAARSGRSNGLLMKSRKRRERANENLYSSGNHVRASAWRVFYTALRPTHGGFRMSTIFIGPHDRKVRFPNERKQDDMPYVPEWELQEALAANRDLVRQLSERKQKPEFLRCLAASTFSVIAGVIIGGLAL